MIYFKILFFQKKLKWYNSVIDAFNFFVKYFLRKIMVENCIGPIYGYSTTEIGSFILMKAS